MPETFETIEKLLRWFWKALPVKVVTEVLIIDIHIRQGNYGEGFR
jgi:hypothetical protein